MKLKGGDGVIKRNPGASVYNRMPVALIDMDCFYAQVEEANNPDLRGKPIGVKQKTLLVTCNYEARKRGVLKTMKVEEATQVCPDLIIIDGSNLDAYREASQAIMTLLQESFPNVQKNGLDEFYVEVTAMPDGMTDAYGHCYGEIDESLRYASYVIHHVRRDIYEKLGYSCSAGIAHSKLFAKLSASLHKPNDQSVMSNEFGQQEFIGTCRVRDIPGFGAASREQFQGLVDVNNCTVDEFMDAVPREQFLKLMPKGAVLYDAFEGIDESKVSSSGESTQLSVEDSCMYGALSYTVAKLCKHLLQMLYEQERLNGKFKRYPKTMRVTFGLRATWKRQSKSQAWPLSQSDSLNSQKMGRVVMKTITEYIKECSDILIVNIAATNFQEVGNVDEFFPKTPEPEFMCDICQKSFPVYAKKSHALFHKGA